jgi:hypothetical protein
MARPTKLTKELQDEIVKYLRLGNYVETVCAMVGINKTTFYDWMKQGARAERKSNKMAKFSNAVKQAMSTAEITDLAIIQQAAKKQWQAAAWRLERRHPKKWGRKDFIGEAEIPVEAEEDTTGMNLRDLALDDLERIEEIIQKDLNGSDS